MDPGVGADSSTAAASTIDTTPTPPTIPQPQVNDLVQSSTQSSNASELAASSIVLADETSVASGGNGKAKPTPTKRASTGGVKVKASSISSKIPAFLSKSSKGNVTYFTMVHEAIVVLANRNGSSVPAIQKFIKGAHPEVLNVTTKQFNTAVYSAIKAGVKEAKLLKVKCSYKVNRNWVEKEKSAFRARENKKKAMERKKKKDAEEAKKKKEAAEKAEKALKLKHQKLEEERIKKEKAAVLSVEDKAKKEISKLDKEAMELKKIDMAKKAKDLADRIKKRRFPMDDLQLIAEDRELGVKRPPTVTKPPYLPFAMQSLLPHDMRPSTKKATPGSIVNACTSTVSSGSRGLMSDVLQVYHFFVGDVGYARMVDGSVPIFTLKQFLYAVNEVVNGNARKSRVVPPLISHLFVTALTTLLSPTAEDWGPSGEIDNSALESLKADLVKLKGSLSTESWGEILSCYINAMEKFYTTDASTVSDALPGFPVSMDLVDGDEEDVDMLSQGNIDDEPQASGYGAYVGFNGTSISKGYNKLLRQDPWHLSADEMISLLRTLTDDIMAMKLFLSKEMTERDEKLFELLKMKKAAESQFRKIRLAHEGPKFPKNKVVKKAVDDQGIEGETTKVEVEKAKFKPTATKKELEVATKARDKALEQFDKGMKNLVHRSQALGFDRNNNAIYYFHRDPDSLYIEVNKVSTPFNEVKTWHCIDSKPLFESFISSLDVRGVRENHLHNELVGDTALFSIKRNLYDSDRKTNLIAAYKRQESELNRRLDNAMIAKAESSRRSGRLATTAKDEVSLIQEEIDQAKFEHEVQLSALETVNDYTILTGIQLLSQFEQGYALKTRCSDLWNIDETKPGIIGKIAQELLSLEDICDNLAPWNDDISRDKWRESIEATSTAWRNGCVLNIGPKDKEFDALSPAKRQRMSYENANGASPNHPKGVSVAFEDVLAKFKGPLLDLEKRIYAMTGIQRATKEVDEANDNISVVTDESDDGKAESERLDRATYGWKKKIYSLHSILPKRASAIRDVLIAAIAIARKANITDVMEDLREALKLHRPGAGGRARTMALGLLQKYGDFERREDDNDEDDIDDSISEVGSMQDNEILDESRAASFFSPGAMVLSGSLEGDNSADRVDWNDAVLSCRTVSRFAALLTALKSRALPRLEKLTKDKKALSKAIAYWETSGKTRKKGKKNTYKSRKYSSVTEIWANVESTDKFVMCKVEGFPWWPACVCVPKDEDIAESLSSLKRQLVSFVGEQHLYVVEEESEVKPFDEVIEEGEITSYPPEVIKNVKNGIVMAKRIMRGRGISIGELKGMDVIEGSCVEEKKTSH